ncbi:hypothetical protein QBC33DRAFT_462558 [Phialemonium atrogriseum]|uniref:Tat pathway signal sequence n=1 Tax=Phialemonium atrogriseum TaxID=1093897 RepID=A0AAJ0BPK5_9PEZI|nr:uncharacterized protein QBC33DRAFT_462558 [Phialemonium atrogriseum]KAK1761845.1 hypothetical protein QBC33DRAFT_462558 [Phialemonium atrogriseum]
MAAYTKLEDAPRALGEESDRDTLLGYETGLAIPRKPRPWWRRVQLPVLYLSNLLLLLIIWTLSLQNLHLSRESGRDPSSTVYSPANEAIEYEEKLFKGGFFTKANEYMGFPTKETDEAWSDLFNFGVSVITPEEAAKLPMPTLPIPDTDKYLVELEVFHVLHCLDDIRKVFYPEWYGPAILNLTQPDGSLDRDNNFFRHFDHCIDAIRQSVMCHADVSPISFHVVLPPDDVDDVGTGIFPRLGTKHTCRNFEKIQDWARARTVGRWSPILTAEEARRVAEEAGYDQASLEDDPIWGS